MTIWEETSNFGELLFFFHLLFGRYFPTLFKLTKSESNNIQKLSTHKYSHITTYSGLFDPINRAKHLKFTFPFFFLIFFLFILNYFFHEFVNLITHDYRIIILYLLRNTVHYNAKPYKHWNHIIIIVPYPPISKSELKKPKKPPKNTQKAQNPNTSPQIPKPPPLYLYITNGLHHPQPFHIKREW